MVQEGCMVHGPCKEVAIVWSIAGPFHAWPSLGTDVSPSENGSGYVRLSERDIKTVLQFCKYFDSAHLHQLWYMNPPNLRLPNP